MSLCKHFTQLNFNSFSSFFKNRNKNKYYAGWMSLIFIISFLCSSWSSLGVGHKWCLFFEGLSRRSSAIKQREELEFGFVSNLCSFGRHLLSIPSFIFLIKILMFGFHTSFMMTTTTFQSRGSSAVTEGNFYLSFQFFIFTIFIHLYTQVHTRQQRKKI